MEEEEVDLAALWGVLCRRRRLLAGVTLLAAAAALLAALLLPPVYRAEVLLAPVTDQDQDARLSSLASRFGGLAAMAGVDIGGTESSKAEAVATLTSRSFTEAFIKEEKLLPVLFADEWDTEKRRWKAADPEDRPTLWDAWRRFDEDVRFVEEDRKTGLVTLAVEWTDPELAARWANELVRRVNARLRERAVAEARRSIDYLERELRKTDVVELQQAIYRLIEGQIKTIMLANVREEYAFRVIDPAAPPREKERPRRALIVVGGTLGGGLLALFLAFFLEFLDRQRERADEKDGGAGP
nr:Wzz/FepE/Etk N-terminal domain-containing protein [Dissulfurirhabdus thermomarina]